MPAGCERRNNTPGIGKDKTIYVLLSRFHARNAARAWLDQDVPNVTDMSERRVGWAGKQTIIECVGLWTGSCKRYPIEQSAEILPELSANVTLTMRYK